MRTRFLTSLSRFGGLGIIATASLLGSAGPAGAIELADVTIDVTVTPTSADPGDRVRTDVEFCVPDSAVGGDTFSVSLAEQLTQLPSTIVLRDPAANTVATADISGAPAVATFTLTDYVNDRIDVCGSAFFESQLRSDLTPNSEQTLTFVVSGGATFDIVVTVGEADTVTDRTKTRKSAAFTNSGDQCRTSTTSCINWFVESMPGPFASVTVDDDGLVDAQFECATLSVYFWSLNPDGSRAVRSTPPGGNVTATCTPDDLLVTVTDVPTGLIARVLISATPVLPDPDGDTTYANVAAVTQVSLTTGTSTVDVGGSARSSAAGGQASGVLAPPASTTTTTSTSTTTTTTTTAGGSTTTAPGATTTTSGVTTTTDNGSGVAAPTTTQAGAAGGTTTTLPATLPATGTTDVATVAIAALLLGAGVALVMVSRRAAA